MSQEREIIRTDSLGTRRGVLHIRGYEGKVLGVGFGFVGKELLVLIRTKVDAGHTDRTYAVVRSNQVLPELDLTDYYAGCRWKYVGSSPDMRHVFVVAMMEE